MYRVSMGLLERELMPSQVAEGINILVKESIYVELPCIEDHNYAQCHINM
jgi:hypothetical protein